MEAVGPIFAGDGGAKPAAGWMAAVAARETITGAEAGVGVEAEANAGAGAGAGAAASGFPGAAASSRSSYRSRLWRVS
jgi:hypothetical protein